MNFLAHFHLAHMTHTSRLGSFLGDFTKGSQWASLPPPIQLGILLHRSIDSFTDQHPEIIRAKSLLSSPRRRFAGIIIDVAFDHYLARDWHQFANQPLPLFAEYTYQLLNHQLQFMPVNAQHTFERMSQHNWLVSYRDPATIHRAIDAIANRLSRHTPLHDAGEEFDQHYRELERLFHRFYPQLIRFSHNASTSLALAQQQKGQP